METEMVEVAVRIETTATARALVNTKSLPTGKGTAEVPRHGISAIAWTVVGDAGTKYLVHVEPTDSSLQAVSTLKNAPLPHASQIANDREIGAGVLAFTIEDAS